MYKGVPVAIKDIEFELFRYQLLPITQHAQEDMFHEIKTTEDIRRNKNKFFFEIISQLPKLTHRTLDLNQRIIVNSSPWLVFQLGAHKTLERANENFKKETIENWPYITVIINNQPEIQLIAVSKNREAFSRGKVVVDELKNSIERNLRNFQLSMHFEARTFWTI